MKYLFAFVDVATCRSFQRAPKAEDIDSEIRIAQEFPDVTQGPELWVHEEDYDDSMLTLSELQRET